jgi:hypothetical protein
VSVSGLVGTVFTGLDTKFNLLGVLPSTVLVVFLFMLAFMFTVNPPTRPDVMILISNLKDLDVTSGIVLAAFIVVLSLIVQPFQTLFVRMLEGYWGNTIIGSWLAKLGASVHTKQHSKLTELANQIHILNDSSPQSEIEASKKSINASFELSQRYPSKERVLPTALGNVLRAAEDSAGQRYGLDTVEVWPRLYPLIPDTLRDIIDSLRNQLDLVTRFCIIFFICFLASVIFYFVIIYQATLTDLVLRTILNESASANFPWNIVLVLSSILTFVVKYSPWLGIPAVMLALTYASYKASIYVGIAYGKGIMSAFDLYRFEVRKTMHLSLPKNLAEERKRNLILSSFLINGKTIRDVNYEHESK